GTEPGTTTNANDDGEVVELTFLTRGNTEEIAAYQRAVDLFNEEHDDIHVNMETIPGAGYGDAIMTRLQGGQAPDIFYSDEHLT
ncbi:extracellular solute-binding protein, partial [Rhodococcoides yunnanense]|uniref:extracellular solute-binding protein n=1 Tax=Rhodococcoides yunnanense TaxID=278209 RepID=UPI0022B0ED85